MIQSPAQRKPPAARRYALALIFFCAFSIFILHVNRVHGGNPPRVTYPQELGRVNFAISGDVIPHEAVVESATAAERNLSEAAPAQPTPAPAADATSPAPASPAAPPTDHDGWDALFAGVADVFRQADFGFVNLETPVAPNHSHGTKAFMFNAPIALLESLKASGINIVSFANNHVFDQGYAAFNETLGHLQEQTPGSPSFSRRTASKSAGSA